jgi:hypothetical protein
MLSNYPHENEKSRRSDLMASLLKYLLYIGKIMTITTTLHLASVLDFMEGFSN